MKNTICVTTKDPAVQTLVTAIKIREEFIQKGFVKRDGFIGVVSEHNDSYKDYDNVKKLHTFWLMRLKDPAVNNDLQIILEKLKSE